MNRPDERPEHPADQPADDRAGERGQGMVEYAFIAVLIGVLLLVAVQLLGHQTQNMYSNIQNAIPG